MTIPILLGAGFNVDASREVGALATVRYPLIKDLGRACFGISENDSIDSIEERFQKAIEAKDSGPISRLVDLVMEADYYLVPHLAPGGALERNLYSQFLNDFETNQILTFNYDSFVELLLFKRGKWRPEDGFGVPVQAEIVAHLVKPPILPEVSRQVVLHLHGTCCVYPIEISIESRPESFDLLRLRDEPLFVFDPERLGSLFLPFTHAAGLAYRHVEERIIAPVPSKAAGLSGEFVKRVYERARKLLGSSSQVVCIGYSFNEHDRESHELLMGSMKGCQAIVVAPDALTTA